eukprot:1718596-Pleurochrysis_carterae.AAC.1
MGTLPLAWALFMLAFALPKLGVTYADTLESAAQGVRLRLSQFVSDVAQVQAGDALRARVLHRGLASARSHDQLAPAVDPLPAAGS